MLAFNEMKKMNGGIVLTEDNEVIMSLSIDMEQVTFSLERWKT